MSEEVLYLFNTYDIRSSANACKTLVGLSGVDISTWEKFVGHESEYRYTDDLVEDVIKRFKVPPIVKTRILISSEHLVQAA